MARPRSIPDRVILAAVRRLVIEGGEKAASFSAVSRASGLAPASLAQRYGSVAGMLQSALEQGWAEQDEALAAALDDTVDKGPQGLLKALAGEEERQEDLALLIAYLDEPALALRAADWRARVEAALAARLSGGEKGREAAALLFAAWMGQALWARAGGRGFRLKEAVRRLG
jgi:AcrR family transcriptional regulator